MRLGIVLDGAADWAALREQAARADELGFDLLWLEADEAVTASALAGITNRIPIALVLTAGVNPVILAEEAAVADLVLGGRLVLVLATGRGGVEELAETVEVVLQAQAPRPFRHDGPQWKIPANFPTNEATEDRIRVTPLPAQIEPSVWLTGHAAADVARDFGLTYVGAVHEDAATLGAVWAAVESDLGPAAARLRRPAVRALGDDVAVTTTVDGLQAEQRTWGLDVAILHGPLDPAGMRALEAIAREHRPHHDARS